MHSACPECLTYEDTPVTDGDHQVGFIFIFAPLRLYLDVLLSAELVRGYAVGALPHNIYLS